MTNTFQRFMVSAKANELIKQIIKIYHPTLDVDALKIKVYLKYDWVVIEATKHVRLGLEVYNGFIGGGWTLKQFEESISTPGKFEVKSWRFVDDAGSIKMTTENLDKYFSRDKAERQAVHDLLIKEQVPLPTGKEMHTYYYKD